MEIKTSTESGKVSVTIIHVEGNIDSSTYEAFQKKVDEQIQGGARYILLDLLHAPFISSAGLRALHTTFNQLRSLDPTANLSDEEMRKGIRAGTYKSPHLKLLNLSPASKNAFEMAGFDLFIETFTDFKTAIAAF